MTSKNPLPTFRFDLNKVGDLAAYYVLIARAPEGDRHIAITGGTDVLDVEGDLTRALLSGVVDALDRRDFRSLERALDVLETSRPFGPPEDEDLDDEADQDDDHDPITYN